VESPDPRSPSLERRDELIRLWPLAAALLVVWLGNLLVLVPIASNVIRLPNDAVGYLAVARNWLEGRGLVDPILYSYYLQGTLPPVPSIALRAPVVSFLFAIPLKLGVGLIGLNVAHAIWASTIGAASLLVARRMMPLAAATACAIAVSWAPSWSDAGLSLLTEATATGMLLLLLFVTPSALNSRGGAVALALLTALGWLTRPNLAIFVPVVLLTAALSWGPRAALRSKTLWVYLLSFLAFHRVIVLLCSVSTGLAPYAHYGVMLETSSFEDVARFQTDYVGAVSFALGHLGELWRSLIENAKTSLHYSFADPHYLYVGWFALPGIVWALRTRGPAAFSHKLVALSAVGFAAVALATGWGFDATRYLLPAAVCAWMAALAMLNHFSVLASERLEIVHAAGAKLLGMMLPLIIVLALVLASFLSSTRNIERWLASGNLTRTVAVPVLQQGRRWNAVSHALCPSIEADALVASPNPWNLLFWCGNAGYLLPSDLETQAWLDRYIDEMRPGYLIADRPEDVALFSESRHLTPIRNEGQVSLFRVDKWVGTPQRWSSPGPLVDLGPRSVFVR
jgi:hypothetical protein